MQVFLPYPSFQDSVNVLDQARLGKQRVECFQLLNAILYNTGWRHHPAAVMFYDYPDALRLYGRLACLRWMKIGHKDSLLNEFDGPDDPIMPPWLGGPIHETHRSNLIRKYSGYYCYFFKEDGSLEYFWPGR